jgi:pyroglutamyl-peptidase
VNPSWEIAKDLPGYLPPLRAKIPGQSSSTGPLLPPIRLLVHPEPIRVNYQVVRSLIPRLWHLKGSNGKNNAGDADDAGDAGDADGGVQKVLTPKPKIDFAIHIGMASPRLHYSIERRGHRDGYTMRDVDGELLGDDSRRLREGKDWIWDGMPAEILTDLDMEDVLRRWKMHSPVSSDFPPSMD